MNNRKSQVGQDVVLDQQIFKDINFLSIEGPCNNYGLQKESDFLQSKGYKLLGNIQWDSVFIKNDFNL